MAARKSSRHEVADFWDAAFVRWHDGADQLDAPLDRWFNSYRGTGRGAVNLNHYLDPYVGDLRGIRNEPRIVTLGLNPGIGFDALQSRDGTWARRCADKGYSQCLARSPAEDPITWLAHRRKSSRYWDNLIRFSQRWLSDDHAGVQDILNFELYPWHSDEKNAEINVPPDLVEQFILDPIAELDTEFVFAFGVDWFDVIEKLCGPPTDEYGTGYKALLKDDTSNWRVKTHNVKSGQRIVISAQQGYAGPPGKERLAVLREVLHGGQAESALE